MTASILAVALVASGIGLIWWGNGGPFARFDEPLVMAAPGQERTLAPVADAPAVTLAALDPRVRTYLIMGVGSTGMDVDEQRALGLGDAGQRGDDRLTDVLMVVVTHQVTGQAAVLSLPRDTWLHWREGRINATYPRHGTQAAVDDIQRLTGIPIHHVARINFQGFADVVDAIGGVDIPTDRALRDRGSKLLLPEAGCYRLDGRTALAYVRSRKTETLNGDSWRTDRENSDFGRIAKQQRLVSATLDQMLGPRLLTQLPALYSAAGDNLVMDRDLDLPDLITLARAFQNIGSDQVEQYTLPASYGQVGAASVVFLDEPAAEPMLERLRDWPPTSPYTADAEPSVAAADTDEPVLTEPATPTTPERPDAVEELDTRNVQPASTTERAPTCAAGEERLTPPADLTDLPPPPGTGTSVAAPQATTNNAPTSRTAPAPRRQHTTSEPSVDSTRAAPDSPATEPAPTSSRAPDRAPERVVDAAPEATPAPTTPAPAPAPPPPDPTPATPPPAVPDPTPSNPPPTSPVPDPDQPE